MTTPSELLTPKQAAERVGLTVSAVHNRLVRGSFPGTKRRGRWLIPASELAAWEAGERTMTNAPRLLDVPEPQARAGDGLRAGASVLRAIAADLDVLADMLGLDAGHWPPMVVTTRTSR